MSGVALVTGGARGIGAATARLAAGRGYAVCVNYVENRAAAESVVAAIARAGGKAIAVAADVARESDVLRLFDTVDRELGRVTLLVNNAGIIGAPSRVDAMDVQRLERMLAVNVLGAMLCAREAVKRMSTKHGGPGGAIVNVCSGFTRSGAPGAFVDYAVTKGALEMFTAGLGREVAAEGIRVNGVRGGLIATAIHGEAGAAAREAKAKDVVPMKRAGQAEEMAKAILWLASGEASYTTGGILDVTGGV